MIIHYCYIYINKYKNHHNPSAEVDKQDIFLNNDTLSHFITKNNI